MKRLVAALSTAVLGSAVLAQRNTWTIGVHFPDLQTAFDSPQVLPGDIVLARGTQRGATLRKGLIVRGTNAVISGSTGLTVAGIAAPEQVVISGFQFQGAMLQIDDCTGLVQIEDMTAYQPTTLPHHSPLVLRIQRCAWVVLDRLSLLGFYMQATEASVMMSDSTILGESGWYGWGAPFATLAVSADRCSMALTNVLITGGSTILGTMGCGQVALGTSASAIGITGASQLVAGSGVMALCRVPAVVFTGGALVLDPSVVVVGSNAAGVVGITPVTRTIPVLSASDLVVGSRATGSVQVPSGSSFAVVLGAPRPPVFVPALNGGLTIDSRGAVAILTGTGSASWAVDVPADAALRGTAWGLQAVAALPELTLSNGLLRVVR